MATMSSLPNTDRARDNSTRTVSAGRGNTFAIYLGHVLAVNRRSTLIWTVSIALYGAMLVAIFPSTKGTTDISSYPESIRDAFSITTLDEIAPYLTGQLMSYLPIVMAFIPITMFASAIAGAEERGSLDVLLGTPLPRRHLVLTTFLAGALKMAIALAVMAIALWLTSVAVDAGLPLPSAIEGAVATWPTAMVPGALALTCSAAFRQRGQVQGITIGVTIAMYALNVVSKLVDSLAWLKYLSVFHYYGAAIEDGIWWWGALVQLVIIAALVAAATWLFERREIYA